MSPWDLPSQVAELRTSRCGAVSSIRIGTAPATSDMRELRMVRLSSDWVEGLWILARRAGRCSKETFR